ncbi:T9SS type A sorting domain-containing protein [Hyunsoonleella ulvae]|uniref:T9SS type A sorting domain-containing protein n=1 Tax=Hyunsoonleella ulvae TaxID=2799948 RepID=UPI00193A6BCD|nr:T9SS type A sorting domain-containing protein [Hyunsoonleella ulvae]
MKKITQILSILMLQCFTTLTLAQNITSVLSCGDYTWSVNGETYTSSTKVTSGSETLHLTVYDNLPEVTRIFADTDYYWDRTDTTYNTSGTYSTTATNADGCTKEYILELTIDPAFAPTNPAECSVMGWQELGGPIGAWEAESVDLDGSGTIVAIGNTRQGDKGEAQVYQWAPSGWTQMGSTLSGVTYGRFGGAVRLSDNGKILAVGAAQIGTKGEVFIYEWNGTDWAQKGSLLTGLEAGGEFGFDIDFSSDGSIIAIGAPSSGFNGIELGEVIVYQWVGTDWEQLGNRIAPKDVDFSPNNNGHSVALSEDGKHLFFGAPFSLGSITTAPGAVYQYDWNGTNWEEKYYFPGISLRSRRGAEVVLSKDGKKVGFTEPDFDTTNKGRVLFNSVIEGETSDRMGDGLATNYDGTVIIAGAPKHTGTVTRQGKVQIFKANGSNWDPMGEAILGELENEEFGNEVAMNHSGNIIAVASSEGPSGDTVTNMHVYYYGCTKKFSFNTTVTVTDADGKDTTPTGSLVLNFEDVSSQSQVQFSIDGGSTYPYAFDDTVGTATIGNLPVGDYNLWARGGDGTDAEEIGSFTISTIEYVDIPSSEFEAVLNDLGYDDAVGDNRVPKANIENVKELDIINEGLSSIEGIEHFTTLIELRASSNNLNSVNISALTALEILMLNGNNISSIDVSAQTDLSTLWLHGNNLSSIDVSNNTQLADVRLGSNTISSLDTSNNTNINTLYCSDCTLTAIDVSHLSNLRRLRLDDNNLTSLDLSNNTKLEQVRLQQNQLEYFTIKNGTNTIITEFRINSNASLKCIEVDDPVYSQVNWGQKDAVASYGIDCTPPVIEILGDNPLIITQGLGYTELGASTDDGSIIMIDDSEFMDAIGIYNIYYDTTDSSGNSSQATRTVEVIASNLSTDSKDFESFKIYPNPATDVLNIKLPQGYKNVSVKVYDIYGKEILEQKDRSGLKFKLNVSNLMSGYYLISINSNNIISEVHSFIIK